MIVARISTVNGSCMIPGYDAVNSKWFLVESIEFGFRQPGLELKKSSDGGLDFNLGKQEETTITITKSIDAASCDLMHQAMNDRFAIQGSHEGKPITADIHFIENIAHDVVATTSGRSQTSGVIAYLRIAMETVKVKEWNISASSDGKPSETVVLWCEQLAMRYQQTADGRIYKDAGQRGWNQALKSGGRSWLPDNSNKFFTSKYYPD